MWKEKVGKVLHGAPANKEFPVGAPLVGARIKADTHKGYPYKFKVVRGNGMLSQIIEDSETK